MQKEQKVIHENLNNKNFSQNDFCCQNSINKSESCSGSKFNQMLMIPQVRKKNQHATENRGQNAKITARRENSNHQKAQHDSESNRDQKLTRNNDQAFMQQNIEEEKPFRVQPIKSECIKSRVRNKLVLSLDLIKLACLVAQSSEQDTVTTFKIKYLIPVKRNSPPLQQKLK